MKESFLDKFFHFTEELFRVVNILLIRESMSRKDLRIAGFDPDKIYSGFKNLERRKLITKFREEYKFTKKGSLWYDRNRLKYLRLNDRKWDGNWRVVIFDIPQSMHRARNNFRHKLKHFGFFMLQKSVFVFPYSCEDELAEFGSRLGINDYVDVIIARSAGFRDKEIRRFFNL